MSFDGKAERRVKGVTISPMSGVAPIAPIPVLLLFAVIVGM